MTSYATTIARRLRIVVVPFALGACMLPGARDVAPRPLARAASRDAAVDAPVALRRIAWNTGARLALVSGTGEGALRYGVDWFGTPGARDVERSGIVFAGLSDALLESMSPGVQGRVAIVLLPVASIDEMMTSADMVQVAATRAGARAVLYVLPPVFGSELVREAADELEAAAAERGPWAADSTEVPAWFVRYDALVQAAAAADLDLPVLVNAAVRGQVGVAPLDGMVVDGRLPRPAGRTGRLAAR